MIRWRFRRLLRRFSPMQLIFGLTGLLFWTIISVLTAPLTAQVLPWLILAFLAVGGISIIALLRTSEGIEVAMQPPITLRTKDECQAHASRGLIVFVSLYNPIKSERAKKLTTDQRREAAERADYRTLDIEKSNLQTAIKAVVSHSSKLEHCWLVATTAKDKSIPISLIYVGALVAFLEKEKGVKCKFHYGPKYAVPLDDDALVCPKTYELIKNIFKEARELGLGPRDMLADFTGCPRSMTLGMILACLDADQDIQFIGTRYDGEGRPIGDIFPVIFSFEPKLGSTGS